jgi:hypothetical protein
MIKNWKTIRYATFASADEVFAALEKAGIVVGWAAGQLIRSLSCFSCAVGNTKVSIVTNSDLGIDGSVTARDFFAKAKVQGHKLCTASLGILTRLTYTPAEQIETRELWFIAIAMEPVMVDGKPMILRIAAGTKGSRLDAVEFDQFTSDPSDKWLFCNPE